MLTFKPTDLRHGTLKDDYEVSDKNQKPKRRWFHRWTPSHIWLIIVGCTLLHNG